MPTYEINVDWVTSTSTVHRAECIYPRGKDGRYARTNPRNGRWDGPFTSPDAALVSTETRVRRFCQICLSNRTGLDYRAI